MSGVRGVNRLGALARDARLAGAHIDKDLKRKLRALKKPAEEIVRRSIHAHLPSGYAPTLAGAIDVKVKTDTGFTSAGVTLDYSAKGTNQLRDIPSINRGELRHPVYGRSRRIRRGPRRGSRDLNPWVGQKVPAGFWDDAVDKTQELAVQHVRDVLNETADILKGR